MRFSKFFLVSTRYVFDKAILLPVISAVKIFIIFDQPLQFSTNLNCFLHKNGIILKPFHASFMIISSTLRLVYQLILKFTPVFWALAVNL